MLSGCLANNNSTKVSSLIEFAFQVNVGNNRVNFDSTLTLTSGKDSLTIQRVRLVFGGDSLTMNDSTIAVVRHKSGWTSFTVPGKLNRNPVRLFQLKRPTTYSQFIFSLTQAPKVDARVSRKFTSNGHRYSMIVEGVFNGEDFTYKSDEEFTKQFSFGPIDLPRYNAHYVILVEADVRYWFPKESGGFYNPAKANTSEHLDSLFAERIKKSLHLKIVSNQPTNL